MDYLAYFALAVVLIGLVVTAFETHRSTVVHSAVGRASISLANDRSLYTNLSGQEARELVDWAVDILEDRVAGVESAGDAERIVARHLDWVVLVIRRVNAVMGELPGLGVSDPRRPVVWVALLNLLNEVCDA